MKWLPDQTRPSSVRCGRRREHPHTHDKSDPEFGPEEDTLFGDEPVALRSPR